jgi:hypothetical protein
MKNLILFSAVLGTIFSVGARDIKKAYQCQTTEESYREVKAKGNIDFTLNTNKYGMRYLTNVNGMIRADWSELSETPSFYEYKGWFNMKSIDENLDYKPRKYKNYSQFRDFDATSSKQGMWGYFVLEKENRQTQNSNGGSTLMAHYIFQAGDHIGGTIDFVCYPDRW